MCEKGPLKLIIMMNCILVCIWEQKTAYCGFLFTIFILTMWFTLYEFALFLQPYVAAEQHTPLSLFQLSSTLYTSLFLSFQVGESCKCAVSLPTPIPPPFKSIKMLQALVFFLSLFLQPHKKKVRGLFSKAFFFTGGIQTQQSETKENRQQNKRINNEMQMCD